MNLSPDITPEGAGSIVNNSIRFDRSLAGSVEEIFEAVYAIMVSQYGTVDFHYGDDGNATGEVLTKDVPRTLVHTWSGPGLPVSTVTWKCGEGSIRLLHEGVVGDEAVEYAVCWHLTLDRLSGDTSDVDKLYQYYGHVA